MRRFYYLLIILLTLLVVVTTVQAQPMRIVGYYTSWSIYARNYHVPDIPVSQVTHINYAFANISDGQIALGDYYADVDRYYPGDSWDAGSLRGCFHQLQVLKAAHPGLKTLISVGGWTWSGSFSDVALTDASRMRFARSCAAFVQQYQFDGVDIDWEYPVAGGLPGIMHRPEDRVNYTLLMAALRSQLDSLAAVNQRPYFLSIAAPAGVGNYVNLQLRELSGILDWMNIMTYDFHGPYGGEADAVTNFNAPLYRVPGDPAPEPYHSQFNIDAAVQAYLDSGVVASKINIGLAFYGHGFGNVNSQSTNGLFASYSGAAPVGTWENGTFDYWDLAANYVNRNGYTRYWQDSARVPWIYNPTAHVMISYDDSASIAQKCQFIAEHHLGGAMFWEFSGDRNDVLLSCAYSSLYGASPRMTIYRSGDNQITLRWEAVPGATSYRVEWSPTVNGFWDMAAMVTGTSYTEPTGSGQKYYRVVAVMP